MGNLYAYNWWTLTLRGLASMAFGIFAFLLPGITLAVFIVAFGIYALVDGCFSLVAGIRRGRNHEAWAAPVFMGLVSIAAGFVSLFWPAITAVMMVYIVAFWAIALGITEIIGAVELRKVIHGEFWLVLAGIASLVAGALMIMSPAAGALALITLISVYALIHGAILLGLSSRAKRLQESTEFLGGRPPSDHRLSA